MTVIIGGISFNRIRARAPYAYICTRCGRMFNSRGTADSHAKYEVNLNG